MKLHDSTPFLMKSTLFTGKEKVYVFVKKDPVGDILNKLLL